MMESASHADVLLVEDLGQQRLPARSLVAVLRRAGLSAQLVPFGVGDDPDEIVALAHNTQPHLVVLSILFAHRVAENLALASRLRAAGTTAHLTMVGPLPTFAYADLLAACRALDSVLRGEAEASIVHLAAACLARPLASSLQAAISPAEALTPAVCADVPGLAYRSPDVRANPLPASIPDLDAMPFPARDDGLPTLNDLGFATVEGSRGCYHSCAFCLPCAFYRASAASPYRLRSIPNLVDEIEELYRQGTRLFLFDDEQFLPPRRVRAGQVQALGDQLKQRGLDIAFTIKCRADDVDKTLFRQLKALGLIRVYLGVESGCQASLDRLGKGVTATGNAQALARLDALDIVADFRCLLFHPWSTLETIRADIEFLDQVLAHISTPYTFHEVECYPGTLLAERLQAEGRARVGQVGNLSYSIADAGAELLRRLGRVVFGTRDAAQAIHRQVVQAWYDSLLLRRFWPERFAGDKARALRNIVARLNRESLAVWREMLSFADGSDLYDADRVNEYAAAWASRVNTFDMTVGEELTLAKVPWPAWRSPA